MHRARLWRFARAGSDVIGRRCRARGVPSRRGSRRGDRHHLRLQIRHAARTRSGRPQSNAPEVSPTSLEQAVAERCAIRARRHHAARISAPPVRLGEFWLSSDAVIPSFSRELRLAHIIDQIPDVEREAFNRIGYTIGGMMVFPGNRVDRKMTINWPVDATRIKDRFDLTVECIRRHYLDEPSPLSDRSPGTQTSSDCSATSRATSTSSICKTWWTKALRRLSSSCRSRTSPRRRCQEPSMRTRVPPAHD